MRRLPKLPFHNLSWICLSNGHEMKAEPQTKSVCPVNIHFLPDSEYGMNIKYAL